MKKPPTSYAEAGIDLNIEKNILKVINSYVKQTFSFANVLAKEGHYANLIKFGDHGLALTTDGVGSKVLVAQLAGKFTSIGIDCVAMNVNDLLAMGIKPAAFVDYLAVKELKPKFIEEIMQGLVKGCELAHIPLLGGELATLPEIITGYENSFDLAGTALGIVSLNKIIDGRNIKPGDSILGITSSGLHSNGYTLARKVLMPKYELDSILPWGRTLQEELLEPTRIYVDVIHELLKEHEVHGLAHITGGGFKKLQRLTDFGFKLDSFPRIPQIFTEMQKIGKITNQEMFSTFNMGIGFVVIVPPEEQVSALETLNRYFKSFRIGEIIRESGIQIPEYGVTY
ncbi:MAG: phosphoribosylformylglycinamidine cyclo-ligase [Candidatus Heimdallarchaeaceae archaeon]